MDKNLDEIVADLIIEVTYQGRLLKDHSDSNLRLLETLRLLSDKLQGQQSRLDNLEKRLAAVEKRVS